MKIGSKAQVKNILSSYEKKWVALNTNRSKVVMSGSSLKDVSDKLRRVKDKNAIVTYVLPFDGCYSPLCHH